MPMVHIWMHEGKSPEYRKQVSEGIHQAMMDVLGVPQDTWDQMFNEMKPGNMVYDRNYFDVPRSEDMIFVHFFFNERPKEMKERFFEAVADEVTARSGLRREDLLMAITEMPRENWWAYGRTVNPDTGYDSRMKGQGLMSSDSLGGRLPLIPPAELAPAARELHDRIVAARSGGAVPFRVQTDAGELIGPFNACLHSPAIGAAFLEMHQGEAKASPLSPRLREVVILSVGAVWGSPYELYAHKAVAAAAGLPQGVVDDVVSGVPSTELASEERAAQRLTLELTRDRKISEEAYADGLRELGRDNVIAVVFLAAAYMGTCTVLNAFAVPAPDDTVTG